MNKAGLTRLLWLVMLTALLTGCGVAASPPTPTPLPTASPTFTPIPPTDTPMPTDTPVPTPTPVPTQSLSSMIDALQPVARGSGVSDAAAYEAGKPGVHPIVILAPEDEVSGWNGDLPEAWHSVNVSQTELVAKIGYVNIELNKTRYRHPGESGWIWVSRIRIDTVVTLYEARTGKQIETKTFQGVDPIGFPSSLPMGTYYLYGDKTPHETVMDWLKSFVEK